MSAPNKLIQKLNERKENNLYRSLSVNESGVDFFSNDYLGFAKSKKIHEKATGILAKSKLKNGSSGSRLISGNSELHLKTEEYIAKFHKSEKALLFNSGYDANLGLLSCVPQWGDIILYDELVHASLRDGIRLCNAKAYKFKHNSLTDLKEKLAKYPDTVVYVIIESVYSMDGDSPDLLEVAKICKENNAFLIIDEAHAVGVFGKKGEGLVNSLGIENDVFARINTFGKALGCHGAAILGSKVLIEYLINFSRPFIYTTALSPHSVATIKASYKELKKTTQGEKLTALITYFNELIDKNNLNEHFIKSNSAIQSVLVNNTVDAKKMAEKLAENNIAAKAILSPTVLAGKERIRFCLHSYNTKKEVELLFEVLIEEL